MKIESVGTMESIRFRINGCVEIYNFDADDNGSVSFDVDFNPEEINEADAVKVGQEAVDKILGSNIKGK